MKKHSIIPIFIPHNGCQNDCVFCNQKNITARTESPGGKQVIATIERNLKTIQKGDGRITEIAFFGGSFTGIPMEEQNHYLDIAKKYKDAYKIDKIRLSTRPDYINDEILKNLKVHGVDIIELGAQSFDDEVLKLANRGHDSSCIINASELIHAYGFELGIQLMSGLPGDTPAKSLYSTDMAISVKADMARIYPTVVLQDTELKNMLLTGKYTPFDEDTMIRTVTQMYRKLKNARITILRVGLKSTDLINSGSELIYGDYHPAFRELIEGRLALEQMEKLIENEIIINPDILNRKNEMCFSGRIEQLSSLAGHKKENRKFLEKKYPLSTIRFKGDDLLEEDEVRLFIRSFSSDAQA